MDTLTLITLAQQEPERAVEWNPSKKSEASYMFHARCVTVRAESNHYLSASLRLREPGLGRYCYHCNGIIP